MFHQLRPEDHQRWLEEFAREAEGGGAQPVSVFTTRSKQKLVNIDRWDSLRELWAHEAHMPLLVFLGTEGHRSEEALRRRSAIAWQRRR